MTVGDGSYGLVWQAECLEGTHAGTKVAIKIIDLEQFRETSLQDLHKEI